MKIFVWNYLLELTSNYHDGGGVVVIAKDLESAREMLGNADANEKEPSFSAELVGEHEPQIFIHPDSGCC